MIRIKRHWNKIVEFIETGRYWFWLGQPGCYSLGMLMGSSKIIMNIINPMVQILRPVSPLAWFPLGLAIFQDSPTGQHFHDIYLFIMAHTNQYCFWRIYIFRRIIKMLVRHLVFQHGNTSQRSCCLIRFLIL